MKCPSCGNAELVHDTRDVIYTYMDQSTTIVDVAGDFCPTCGEVVLDRENGDRYSSFVGSFHEQVNADLVRAAMRDVDAGRVVDHRIMQKRADKL